MSNATKKQTQIFNIITAKIPRQDIERIGSTRGAKSSSKVSSESNFNIQEMATFDPIFLPKSSFKIVFAFDSNVKRLWHLRGITISYRNEITTNAAGIAESESSKGNLIQRNCMRRVSSNAQNINNYWSAQYFAQWTAMFFLHWFNNTVSPASMKTRQIYSMRRIKCNSLSLALPFRAYTPLRPFLSADRREQLCAHF